VSKFVREIKGAVAQVVRALDSYPPMADGGSTSEKIKAVDRGSDRIVSLLTLCKI
jgi:hypothetical protein